MRAPRKSPPSETVILDYEALLEVSYTAQIVPGFTIQPDFQYFWNPGGHVRRTRTIPRNRP